MSRPTPLIESGTRLPPALRRWLGARLQGPPPGTACQQRSTCVFALGRIGDFIVAASALRLLARAAGPGGCTLVIRPELAALATAEVPDADLIMLPGDAPSLVRDMIPAWWRERPKFAATWFTRKVALCHYRSLYQEIVYSWICAEQAVHLTDATYPAASGNDGTELAAHRLVTATALGRGVTPAEIEPRLIATEAGNDGRLLVYPLSHDGSRSLPAERIAAILRHWRGLGRKPVVLGGSPRDLVLLESYAAILRAAGVGPVTVEAPAGVPAFIRHVAAAGAVLSADSAAAHAGIALDKSVTVLMPREWYGLLLPWRRSARQKIFLLETADADIAAALPPLE